MQTSIFLAKLLGPMFAVVGITILSEPEAFHVLLKEFIEGHMLMYLAGFLGLVAGLALVLTHNVWLLEWRLIITVIGWATIVCAVVIIFQPQWIASLGLKIIKNQGIYFGAAVIDVVIGLFLSYFVYIR